MDTDTTASPPTYAEAVSDVADDLLQAVILVLDGQSIHAESNPAVPLYQVNRGIAHLGLSTSVVEFARMERRVGRTKQRSRHIYNLHHVQPLLRIPSARRAEYFIQAVAAPARRLGHLGLKQARTLADDHWTALPVDMKGWAELDRPPFVADTAPVFEAHHRQGACKWVDGDGRDVAMEYDSDQEHRLLVTASMQRETRDALVALWCCRVWQQSVDQQRSQTVQTRHVTHTLPIGWKKFL
ncbi:hypothetical protein CONLIGDRAFT_670485 [Coniochaeta ligniaria NRRL 30616]|uniref:Uncharacterized protein n=1 Tax=Coniochaeta ligniaria NRRL 30616 TaxID=1408157 RepID=A0A1J7IMA5_9PEZI|nr:hypothetical protein CONLIGDRAFT_670485 [Coniochaeta ligniaria NRRL 30616]